MRLDHPEEMIREERSGNGREIWVNKFTEESAQKFREQVMERASDDPNMLIPIYIDSYGGYVDSLAKMIETMNEVPNRFLTICHGKAISCGAILLSHGDVRFCGKYSRVMVHNVSSGSWGDAYSLRADSEETMRLNRIFMGLLASNCEMTYEQLQEHIKNSIGCKEIWMDAADAQKFGIIDHVGTPAIAPVVQWSVTMVPDKPRLGDEEPEAPAPKKKATTKKKKKKS